MSLLHAAGKDCDIASLIAFDGDADAIPDCWEARWLLDTKPSPQEDSDRDGLTKLLEYRNGCDPRNVDSDADGVGDGTEVNTHGTDPLNFDTDEDGLTDLEEVQEHETDPCLADTDGDGLPDDWEVEHLLSSPLDADSDDDGVADGMEDGDHDGLTNAGEYARGTDPEKPDIGRATVSFQVASTRVKEANAAVQVQVALSQLPPHRENVTVRIVAHGSTAKLGTDYQFTSTTLTFTAGNLVGQATVRVLADEEREADEMIRLRLVECEGARTIRPDIHTVIIADAISAGNDTDKDGLPDSWETKYFGNLAQGPDDDPDKDGMANLLEYKIGPAPTRGSELARLPDSNCVSPAQTGRGGRHGHSPAEEEQHTGRLGGWGEGDGGRTSAQQMDAGNQITWRAMHQAGVWETRRCVRSSEEPKIAISISMPLFSEEPLISLMAVPAAKARTRRSRSVTRPRKWDMRGRSSA